MKFRACTWNVHHSNGGKELAPHVEKFVNLGVDIFLLQEVKPAKGALDPFTKRKYRVRYVTPEFAVAWNPERFEYVRHRKLLMSPLRYWTLNYALTVVLKDKRTGKLVRTLTYHPPAHVQAPKHVTFPKVTAVLKDVVQKWNRLSRKAPKSIDAHLYGGDDNVDENTGWSPAGGWDLMLHGPLTQVQAPRGTHGGRQIDDFRIRGLKCVNKVGVYETPSDHDAFIADFDYQR
jgi:hypothetical protein